MAVHQRHRIGRSEVGPLGEEVGHETGDLWRGEGGASDSIRSRSGSLNGVHAKMTG